jgi:hypothetical protein
VWDRWSSSANVRHADYYAVAAQLVALAAVAIAVELRFSEYQSFRSRFSGANWWFNLLAGVFTSLAALSLGSCLYALAMLEDTLALRLFAVSGVVSQALLVLRLWFPADYHEKAPSPPPTKPQ